MKNVVDIKELVADPDSRYFLRNGEPVLKDDPDFVCEHYNLFGEYIGAPEPLPKDMKMMAMFMDEFMSGEVTESVQEVNEKIRLKVEAMPEYQDGKNPPCIRYHGKTPLFAEEPSNDESEVISSMDMWESESTFPEVPGEIISSEEESTFPEMDYSEYPGDDSWLISYSGGGNSSSEDNPPVRAGEESRDTGTAMVLPEISQWSDLTDAGCRLAAEVKRNTGEMIQLSPLMINLSPAAMALKGKLEGDESDFHEAVKNILSGMVVDNLVQSQTANLVLMSLDTPFSSEYMKLLKTKHQLENQVLKIIETRQRLTTVPIRIRHAAQVNVGQVQQVVNRDDRQEG